MPVIGGGGRACYSLLVKLVSSRSVDCGKVAWVRLDLCWSCLYIEPIFVPGPASTFYSRRSKPGRAQCGPLGWLRSMLVVASCQCWCVLLIIRAWRSNARKASHQSCALRLPSTNRDVFCNAKADVAVRATSKLAPCPTRSCSWRVLVPLLPQQVYCQELSWRWLPCGFHSLLGGYGRGILFAPRIQDRVKSPITHLSFNG